MSLEIISGSDLKILLKRKGIMITDLVQQFGFNRVTISKYFNDHSQMPAIFLLKIAKYADLTLDELIVGTIDDISNHDIAAESAPVYKKVTKLEKAEQKLSDLVDEVSTLKKELKKIKSSNYFKE